jgi:catalase
VTRENLAVSAVEAIEKAVGSNPGYRRAHPRGLVCSGVFDATPEARALTVAEHFQGGSIRVAVRLSNGTGSPFAPDRASDTVGKVLGLAVRFQLPSGKVASWAAVNLPSFVARTPEDFVRLTLAQRPTFFGKPNPLALVSYLVTRRSVFPGIKAIATMKPVPSFVNVDYGGLHTYFLVDAGGKRQPVRYRWVPRAGIAWLRPDEASKLPPQYLLAELRDRLARGPAQWDLRFQLAEPGDPLDDASRAWPADRRTQHAGTLTVTNVESDQNAHEGLVFDPTGVVPGIELSDDPILRIRAGVYSESYRRRSTEKREKPSPADMGQS